MTKKEYSEEAYRRCMEDPTYLLSRSYEELISIWSALDFVSAVDKEIDP